MKVSGECKLCGQHKGLVHSHILPEFLYKPMYDEKHRFLIVSPDPNKPIQTKQKGYREHLLCDVCDGKLGQYEKYVKEFMYDGKGVEGKWSDSRILLRGLDYAKTRLYYISLLWRMSVSSLPLFRSVSLGPHEDKIRQMLINEDPGEPNQYGFVPIVPLIDGQIYSDWIQEPVRTRFNGHWLYWAVIGGILYFFTTNPKAIPSETSPGLLQKNGEWRIKAMEIATIPFLHKYFLEQAKGSKQREMLH